MKKFWIFWEFWDSFIIGYCMYMHVWALREDYLITWKDEIQIKILEYLQFCKLVNHPSPTPSNHDHQFSWFYSWTLFSIRAPWPSPPVPAIEHISTTLWFGIGVVLCWWWLLLFGAFSTKMFGSPLRINHSLQSCCPWALKAIF